ncbi:hypothetical protein ES707_10871 [subsurface metagenome]
MRQKRVSTHSGGPRVRPYDPADVDRIAAGVERSMQMAGYDYPIRKLRKRGNSNCVTLPLQVRSYLALERGDWLAFGFTRWAGVAAFVKVTAAQYEAITADGRKEFRKLARKVQGRKGTLGVDVPPAVCKLLSAEAGDSFHFSPRSGQCVVNISAIKGGGESAGSRRTG